MVHATKFKSVSWKIILFTCRSTFELGIRGGRIVGSGAGRGMRALGNVSLVGPEQGVVVASRSVTVAPLRAARCPG